MPSSAVLFTSLPHPSLLLPPCLPHILSAPLLRLGFTLRVLFALVVACALSFFLVFDSLFGYLSRFSILLSSPPSVFLSPACIQGVISQAASGFLCHCHASFSQAHSLLVSASTPHHHLETFLYKALLIVPRILSHSSEHFGFGLSLCLSPSSFPKVTSRLIAHTVSSSFTSRGNCLIMCTYTYQYRSSISNYGFPSSLPLGQGLFTCHCTCTSSVLQTIIIIALLRISLFASVPSSSISIVCLD